MNKSGISWIRVDSTITFEGIQWKNEGEATVHSKLLVTYILIK